MRVAFRTHAHVALGTVFSNLTPVVTGRGVGQISGYVDNLLASLLPTGAVAALNYAQILYLLPVSLFGMSVAAAELPRMSRATGTVEEVAQLLRLRLNAGLRQIAFLVVPSAAAFLFLGDVIVGAASSSRATSPIATRSTYGRCWPDRRSGCWRRRWAGCTTRPSTRCEDTRTPLKFALVRVTLTLVLGYLCAIPLPPVIGIAQRWGVAGLTASAGIAAWVEFALLRWRLNSADRIDRD